MNQMKIGWITTASKAASDLSYLEKHKKAMEELDWNFEEIDIEGKTEDELRSILAEKDLVHVEGGSTFYLLNAVLESGFDKVVREFIGKGGIYAGTSAGSYIMCPTIEMSTWKNKWDRLGLTDLTALNMVPFLVFAHYDPIYKELLREKIAGTKYDVRILKDDQAILFMDGEARLVGEGEEIKL